VRFETERLICQSLTLQDYEDFEAGCEPKWDGFTNPYKCLVEGPSPLQYRIPRVKKEPSFAEIALIIAISKDKKEIIGSAGFHLFPDDEGMIEIGFGIVSEMQNKGYGKELLHGMWLMISERPDVKTLRYTVTPDNAPSVHIIKSLGFNLVGEQMDEEDGLELIYELPLQEYLQNFHRK